MTRHRDGAVRAPWSANRLGLDYRREAERLGPPPAPIVDAHAHIHGLAAARVYREVCDLYGVTRTYSMSTLAEAEDLKVFFGDAIRFIAVPEFMAEDRLHAHTEGFLDAIERFHGLGARVVKFWTAPRSRDYGAEVGDPSLLSLDNPWRIRAMEKAHDLGMMFMVHVADPDTWFTTTYADASVYGTKESQYEPLERAVARYPDTPWLLAHLGGWPEDLAFLDGLLTRHSTIYLDTSATKWMVRVLSAHPTSDARAFFERWRGRLLFGSDIVTMDAHLAPAEDPALIKAAQASTPAEAFELYASRYWALRTLFETDYRGESPIADPDLAMVDPERFDANDAPVMRGLSLPKDALVDLYHTAATDLLERWAREHP